MTIKLCYWRSVSISSSNEGEVLRRQHPEIDFHYCRETCRGFPPFRGEQCSHYIYREMFSAEDSSIVNLLDVDGGLEFPV